MTTKWFGQSRNAFSKSDCLEKPLFAMENPVSCNTHMRKSGAHLWNSAVHWAMIVVGRITKADLDRASGEIKQKLQSMTDICYARANASSFLISKHTSCIHLEVPSHCSILQLSCLSHPQDAAARGTLRPTSLVAAAKSLEEWSASC